MITHPDMQHERDALAEGHSCVCGIDEAGRGPLAGPVVAAAVVLPPGYELQGLTDSKQLSARQRDRLYDQLMLCPDVRKAIAQASVAEIDQLNILRATHLAMARAAQNLSPKPDFCLIDGLPVPGFPIASRSLVKGDALCLSIAAASVLAKVTRDRLMRELHEQFPQYGWARNAGYGTAQHLKAIKDYGITPHHRRSFAPVAQATLPLEF